MRFVLGRYRQALCASVSALACIAAAADQVSDQSYLSEPTARTAARWGVPPFFNDWQSAAIASNWSKRLTGYLKARDGTALRYSVLLPEGAGPFPVIINYSGYDPGAIGGYAYLHNDTAMSTSLDHSLLERGYAVLGVNARGTGCSEGTFDFLAPSYGQDGADIVEWAATQGWSNGAIGMANWSWAGMSQVATASERPPHLKAIAPGMALTDPRLDSWEIGGVPSQGFLTGWWMFLHSRWLAARHSAEQEKDMQCLAQLERNYAVGETPAVNLPSQLIRHPLRDEWIENRTILKKAANIEVPVLSMEAFQDEATTARAGYYQERLHPDRLWYVQTNGNHDLYESLQFRSILLDFLDRFVKGASNGFEKRPHVEIWQESTSQPGSSSHQHDEQAKSGWIIRRDQYPAAVELKTFNLAANHALLDSPAHVPAGRGFDSYRYPIEAPGVDIDPYKPAWGALSPAWRRGSLAYTSAALPQDLVIYGPASADLWVSTNGSDTDLQVTLTDVRPDGQEQFVQRGWLRMSNRALDLKQSTDLRPWPCDQPACIQSMVPEIPALGRVELTKVSYAFRRGSKLRIWIETPSATGGNRFDHAALASVNKIWHDETHPSTLRVGVLAGERAAQPQAACGNVLMQPCRTDPLAK